MVRQLRGEKEPGKGRRKTGIFVRSQRRDCSVLIPAGERFDHPPPFAHPPPLPLLPLRFFKEESRIVAVDRSSHFRFKSELLPLLLGPTTAAH